MFPRSLRLTRAGFELARKLPRTTTPHFSITYSTSGEAAGIGIIVPKKVAKSSVQRHLLKRRLREILRSFLREEMGVLVVVVSARSGAAELSFEELKEELSAAFNAILARTTSAS